MPNGRRVDGNRDTVQDMQIVKRQLRPHFAALHHAPLTALDLAVPPFGNYNSDWDSDSELRIRIGMRAQGFTVRPPHWPYNSHWAYYRLKMTFLKQFINCCPPLSAVSLSDCLSASLSLRISPPPLSLSVSFCVIYFKFRETFLLAFYLLWLFPECHVGVFITLSIYEYIVLLFMISPFFVCMDFNTLWVVQAFLGIRQESSYICLAKIIWLLEWKLKKVPGNCIW